MVSRQLTFEDVVISQFLMNLKEVHYHILGFLADGYYQSMVAQRLGVSKGFVNEFTKKLLSFQLIKIKHKDPLQHRATVYEIGDQLQALLKKKQVNGRYTFCIPHHIRFKYPLLSINKPVSKTGWRFKNAKIMHVREFSPRGWTGQVFHVRTRWGRMGVTVYPQAIEVYQVDRGHIMALSVDEATNVIAMELQNAMSRFVQEQTWEGVHIQLGDPEQVGNVHYGFPSNVAYATASEKLKLTADGVYVDKSPEEHGEMDTGEIETESVDIAEQVDRGLRSAISVEGKVAGIEKKVIEVHENVNAITAHMMSGRTVDQQILGIIDTMSRLMTELNRQRSDIETLKNGNGNGRI